MVEFGKGRFVIFLVWFCYVFGFEMKCVFVGIGCSIVGMGDLGIKKFVGGWVCSECYGIRL